MRYFINIADGSIAVADPEGTECSTFDQAREEASQSARDIMAHRLMQGRTIGGDCFVELLDENRQVLESTSFRELALGTADSDPEA